MRPAERVTPELLRAWPLPEPDDDGDKSTRGTVHVLGGAVSTPGAVLLAGVAALRAGAGKLMITTVAQTAVGVAVAVPEAKVEGVASDGDGSLSACQVDGGADAFVVGPGILAPGSLVECVLPACGSAGLVIDAVALHDLPDRLPARTVLTPNVKELVSLADREGEPDDLAVEVAAARGAVVVTRGWVAAPDGALWRDEAGSITLATSGSGDVLAGIIGGLLARGAEPAQAGCWGQYLHGRAGARRAEGRLGLLARELLDEVPLVLADLT
ncbi:MAG: NAD(P)H-hydrate dehydratase [Frankiales bacterium]|nr:NAD(P)H-hydrate dehydratase [Frankiales bacterium]